MVSQPEGLYQMVSFVCSFEKVSTSKKLFAYFHAFVSSYISNVVDLLYIVVQSFVNIFCHSSVVLNYLNPDFWKWDEMSNSPL